MLCGTLSTLRVGQLWEWGQIASSGEITQIGLKIYSVCCNNK